MTKMQEEYLTRLAKRSKRPLRELEAMWEERAAIMEHCGEKKRAHAERDALDDVANEVLR